KDRTAPVEPAAPAPVHPKKTKKKSMASQTEDLGSSEINHEPQNVSQANKKCQASINPTTGGLRLSSENDRHKSFPNIDIPGDFDGYSPIRTVLINYKQ
ncbi:hypothetical protein L9F63_017892, partial [Diploptera punctata]